MKRAFVVGASGHGNIGDDYLALSIAGLLTDRGLEVVLVCDDIRLWPSTTPQSRVSVMRTIRRSDLVVIGGGSLLSDRWGAEYMKYFASLAVIARCRGARPIGIGLGISTPRSRVGHGALAVWRASVIRTHVRDRPSLQVAKAAGLSNVTLGPDLGWAGPARRLSQLNPPRGPVVLALSLVGETAEAGARRVSAVATAINALAAQGLLDEVVGFSMLNRAERELNDAYWLAALQDRVTVPVTVPRLETWSDVADVIDRSHAVLSYRLHGGIIGYQRLRPVVVVARESKVEEAFRGLPGSAVVPEDSTDISVAIAQEVAAALQAGDGERGVITREQMVHVSESLGGQCVNYIEWVLREVVT